ncbi:unnamed protein product, partial [Vitis vinifera]|uniref:Uncharacterized protein n=1 Tax=Vitis vinifera TaxID=29760 RepID=D7U3V1_VITVI
MFTFIVGNVFGFKGSYGYICKNNFFVFVLSGCHASTWRDLHKLNLFK